MGGTAGRRHTARGSGARTYTSSMPAAKPTQKDDTSADARKPIARYFVFFFDSPSFFASSFEPAFEPDVEPDVEPDFEPDVEPVEVRGVRGLGGPARGVRGLGGPARGVRGLGGPALGGPACHSKSKALTGHDRATSSAAGARVAASRRCAAS